MKHSKLFTIAGLPLMWALYFLFELISGRVTDYHTVLGNLLLIILFTFTGYIIYTFSLNHFHGISFKIFFLFLLILIIVDQGIKIIIKFFFFDDKFEIIPNILSFHPIINTDGSWLNARFGTSVSFSLLIILNIIFLFLIVELFRYLLSNGNKTFWSDMAFVFLFCGSLCSLIDKVFYGGSLDFIGISNLFIADIKDLYINLGLYFFLLGSYSSGYLTSDDNSSFKDDMKYIKKVLLFIKTDLTYLIKR
jgi:signal peptidase II